MPTGTPHSLLNSFQHLFHQHQIKWSFNPTAASHHGGVWEWLIRFIRKVMNSTVRKQVLEEEGLHTVLCKKESIINSRPIKKASSDLNDLEALTPNHLLLLQTKPSLSPGLFNQDDLYTGHRWKQVQYMSILEKMDKRILTSSPGASCINLAYAQKACVRWFPCTLCDV